MSQFPEIFKVEMQGWCYGIERYPGEIYSGLVLVVIKEFKDILKRAIENEHVFDILQLSEDLCKSAKYVIEEREVAFAILAQLPNPIDLSPQEQKTLAAVINPVEKRYGGAHERLKFKWANDNQRRATLKVA